MPVQSSVLLEPLEPLEPLELRKKPTRTRESVSGSVGFVCEVIEALREG